MMGTRRGARCVNSAGSAPCAQKGGGGKESG